ncbi:MAG: tetratricopeptide repeat protein [Candidatus Aminicenantes bacterium]|nr:tetratricopeptide repeat protein [Candidatus Aminicenantes bacterium]
MEETGLFISYSWEKESESIADALDAAFNNRRGMRIIRDKRDLEYKGLIKEFMRRLGKGKYVILIISEHYLKSENCMYELLQIAKNKKFRDRIFPLVLESAKIYEAAERLEYIQYWEKRIADLDEKIKAGSQTKIEKIFEDLNFYKDIRNNIDKLLGTLSDMNALSMESHRQTAYEVVYKAIKKKIRVDYGLKQIKILSMTASPKEANPVLYEQEQDTLLKAFKDFDREDIFLDMPDPVKSTMAEIEDHLIEGHHDILQITAHGAIDKEGKGVLSFEDEQGRAVEVSGEELAALLLRLKEEQQIEVSLVILSSCHSARKELHLMPAARALQEAGVAAVIGMKEAISHDAAMDFNLGFFSALQEKKNVLEAFKAGREAVAAGERIRLRDMPNWDRVGEEQIPQLLSSKETLSMAGFSGFVIDAPERPGSHQFLNANYLERGFIGRRNVLRKVYRQAEEGAAAVVLKGPGGIGKSTITTRAAAGLRRGGYEFIVIPGETKPESILLAISQKAAEMGVPHAEEIYADPGVEIEQKLTWFLEKFLFVEKVALIFDNFEENQELPGGEFIKKRLKEFLWSLRDYLKNKKSLMLFSTRYKIPGFEAIDVPEFSQVECRKLLLNHKALKRLDGKSASLLIREIGGNPRALELLDRIAEREFGGRKFSWVELKDLIPELTGRIINKKSTDDDFTPLFLGKLTAYLDEPCRRLLAVLSLYRYPVGKEAVEAHAVKIKPPDRMKLEEMSLVEYDREAALYYVHRLSAHFVLQRQSDETRDQAHLRAAEYFESLENDEGKRYVADWIEARWHLLQAGEWDRAAQVTFALEDHLTLIGYPQLSLELLTELPVEKISEKNRSIVCLIKGNLFVNFSDYDAALYYYEQALSLSEIMRNEKDIAGCMHQIGIIHQQKGEYHEALIHYNRSLEIRERINDIEGIADSFHNIGTLYHLQSNYDTALKYYEKSMKITEQIGDSKRISKSQHQIGIIYKHKGKYNDALCHYEKFKEISEQSGDIAGLSLSLHEIGMIYQIRGDYDAALRHYEKSLEIKEKIGDNKGVAETLLMIGMVYYFNGDDEGALKQYRKSREISEEIGDIKLNSYSLHNIGMLYQESGDYESALKHYEKSMEIKERIRDIRGVSSTLHQIARLYHDKDDSASALEHYEKSLEIKEKIGDIPGMGLSFGQMGKLHLEKENYPQALRYLIKAFLSYAQIESPNVNLAKEDILTIKEKIPAPQFAAILAEFDIPADHFDIDERTEEEEFTEFIEAVTADAVRAKDKSMEEKLDAVARIQMLSADMEGEPQMDGVIAYLEMLLAYIDDEDYLDYKTKVPPELYAIFESISGQAKPPC